MENNKEYKYVMIVTSEDERYESGEKDLSSFGEHPWEGKLEAVVFGNSFDDLFGDGEHEGLFQQTYEMETGIRLSYGFLDPDTPREEIEEHEKKREYSKNLVKETKEEWEKEDEKKKDWKDIVIETAEYSDWKVTINKNDFTFHKYSSASQDFILEIKAEASSFKDLCQKVVEYYSDFDVSRETYLWLDDTGHGKNGAPYDMIEVYHDMEECEELIQELKDDLISALYNYNEEEE